MEASRFRMWPVEMNFSEEDFMESLERALPPLLHLQPLPPLPVSLPPPPATETHCVTNSEKRSIERLELNRNLLYCVEMQINKKSHKKLKKLLKKIALRGLITVGTSVVGLFLFDEVKYFSLMITMSVPFISDIFKVEIACYLKLGRMRTRRSLIRMRRIALREMAEDLREELREPYNGFLMSPSEATIEIHSARARVVEIEDTLVREIEDFGTNHGLFFVLTFVGSLLYVAVIVSSAWFLRRGN
ncbi:PREDICTED: uncharacterized protein LOC105948594 [Erythranthe guttata]|uniref:uncharacterized protein LOC105948594 n=1 Tax=Erythranthe guttata TaxID=4155 RepID=UPI00064DF336|nr:PREDICTED: uncharacterized protein LOC105948594 [Erythranthe guttata]|eukprot:XP_012827269.1 PREDICTED: uncharacterized protein LOC105948594 [Erythranthe guttata]